MSGGVTVDIAAFNDYLRAEVPAWAGVSALAQMKGGQSNPTFRAESDNGPFVLRMRPRGAPLLSLIHISEPTRQDTRSRMPSSA